MAGEPRLGLDPAIRGSAGPDSVLVRVDGPAVAPTSPTLDTLKDVPELRAYRDFLWRVGISTPRNRLYVLRVRVRAKWPSLQ